VTPRPPWGALAILGSVIAGIVVGQVAGPSGAGLLLIVAIGGVAASLLVHQRALQLAIALLAFAMLGTATTQRALHGLTSSPFTEPVAMRSTVTVRGALVDDPGGGRWNATVLVRASSFRNRAGPWRDGGGRRVLVSASSDVASRVRVLEAGDGVTVQGWLEPLSGFDTRARWQHAVATLHATELLRITDPQSPLIGVANSVRGLVLAGAEQLAPVDRALLSGFLVGDTRGLPFDLTEQFRAAGLTHLVAVSGENVAFVLALFAPLFRRLPIRGRLAAGLAVLVLFGTMTRWEPSVLRAITMASIGLTGAFLGRPAAGLRVLVLAATALLLADPFLLHSVGFGLSCGASLGIAVLSRPIANRLRGPRWMRETLAVTAAAQVGVAPVLIPVFGSMPLVALPANLVAVPLAAPLTIWGLAAGVVSGLVRHSAPQLATLVQLPTVGLLHAIISVADIASRVPVAVDGRAVWGLIALAALAAALHRSRRVRRDGRSRVAVPTR
jgi:competence protein ComEC